VKLFTTARMLYIVSDLSHCIC